MDPVALAIGELKGSVDGMSSRITDMGGRVDELVKALATQEEGHERRMVSAEKRIGTLEVSRGWLTGALGVLASVAGWLGVDRVLHKFP